ncbi:hypothetical protein BT67DRAFT_442771 [Trichocladium antarcticum]|uniref:Uncharacterized protein n=1 Tax=Trichocladium antarcticum TaxID=1450529 RepID=A0AAN6UHW6_9PEZI|nr:hypothetical protein BT67DRAFT_442771 [Trichocladium antarcticum]
MAAWAALLGAGCSRVGRVVGSRARPRGLRCWELGVAGWAALPGAGYGQVGCVARSRVRPR